MTLELLAVGGYNEVGKNMTAIKYNNEVIIIDMGFYMPAIVEYEEQEGHVRTLEGLRRREAIPDDSVMEDWKDKVKAILTTHCHLDHLGAIPFLASKYKCPVIATPYSIEVLKRELHEEKIKISNKLITLNHGSSIKISKSMEIEFINVTHSTPQTVFVVIHTPDGSIIYTNDFKFDNHPTLGKKPDYERMKKIAEEKEIRALIIDALYADKIGKTPSEKVAKQMLEDVLLGTNNEGNLIMITTFASHIARLKNIIDLGKRLKRKIVFLGRSLSKYVSTAENINLVSFTKDIEILSYPRQIQKKLNHIEKKGKRKDYLIVCTGNQAEPNSVLVKIAFGRYKFKFQSGDHVIFSSKTIPVSPNIENREKLEERLKSKKVRIFKEVHVSGHAYREDIIDLIRIFKPKFIIPGHCGREKLQYAINIAEDLDYKEGKSVLKLKNSQKVTLKE